MIRRFQIDLAHLTPQVALFPSPDNVQPVSAVLQTPLSGCFIGACTTAEEDLVLGALVLEQCLLAGWVPAPHGQRRVTPGSQVIIDHLRHCGVLDIYERAGFTVGAPGCSFCLGIAADVAKEGEVWLSSQNRNYRNRMGKGSIAHLASAVTVAASSFSMTITDPTPFLAKIDPSRLASLVSSAVSFSSFEEQQSHNDQPYGTLPRLEISEPSPELYVTPTSCDKNTDHDAGSSSSSSSSLTLDFETLEGRAQVFGDNIDTDAILPGEFLCENDVEALGKVAFLHTNPDFRAKVKQGQTIIVAGHGFGCGSSREQAVTCLKGAGVAVVIAKSFGYIFSRNVQNFALVGIRVTDETFYHVATENASIRIHMKGRTIVVNEKHTFRFQMSLFEETLLAGGGIMPLYRKFGNRLFRVAVEKSSAASDGNHDGNDEDHIASCNSDMDGCGSATKALDVAW